jgi:hypothetical protein
MHYFLGLEVWQRTDEILLSQGKYTVEILKKFGMTGYKSMPTPLVMNLKKLSETSFDSDEIDPHLYKQLIGSLMYLVNTRPDICYAVSILSQFISQLRQTLDSIEACVEIFTRHNWSWTEICLRCRHEIARIYQCRLGRERSVSKEHLWLLFYFGICHGFLRQLETDFCGFEYHRSRVHCIMCGRPQSSVALQALCRLIWT